MGVVVPAGAAQALPPKAAFAWGPEAPITGQQVTFTSNSTPDPSDPTRTIAELVWDLDDDGQFDDAAGPTATWTFTRPGQHRVYLEVADSAGERDTTNRRVVIGNRPPVPSVVLVPAAPSPGQPVTLVSSSYDPDGFITAYDWDLDGNGIFGEAGGSSVSTSFALGRRSIGLRVTDDSGASTAAILSIDVGGLAGSGVRSVRVLSPFPVVRVTGIVRKRGIRLRLLSVSAPIGATVNVRCRGRGCPFKRKSRVVKAQARASAPLAPATGLVRIRRFARRLLRAGATVKVFVTRPDAIGKYTRLRVRRARSPARVDRCVTPALVPLACPS